MESIELWSKTTKAIVDPQGAWLTNLSDDNGDILYPKRQLKASDGSTKIRGGCHVCLPNFGPGGTSGLAQHGFGRTEVWEVLEQQQDALKLQLQGTGAYIALLSTLHYEVKDSSMTLTLELLNRGGDELRVGPAFHPYFALAPGRDQVELDGQPLELAELEGTLFEEGTGKTLRGARRPLQLTSSSLSTWAIWTDQLGPYVCVEPTLGGYTFLQEQPTDEELLGSGATARYGFTVSW